MVAVSLLGVAKGTAQDALQNGPQPERHIAGAGTAAAAWQACPRLAAVPFIGATGLVPDGGRAVIVAPHPDDETLGCAGLIQALLARGSTVQVVSVTDGDASHPGSARWPPAALGQRRAQELRAALGHLGALGHLDHRGHPGATAAAPLRLGVPDGAVAAFETRVRDRLMALVEPGDVLLTTWRFDGHPDHEACARACAAVAKARAIPLVEFPIWAWHWARPDSSTLPWRSAAKFALTPDALARKRAAVAAFASQTEARGDDDPVLPPWALARLLTPYELFFHDCP